MTLKVRIVRDRDRGAKALLKRIRGTGGLGLKVGILGSQATAPKAGSEELTLVSVATFHEFGRGNNPERSFLRTTVDAEEPRIKDMQRRIARGIAKGKLTEVKGLGLIGAFLAAEIQKRIQSGIKPMLKAATLLQKGAGKTTPLILTGQLVQSITWKVVK